MEARLTCAAIMIAAFLSTGAGYRTENFIINCPDRDFAVTVGEEAERFRRELAIEWLGDELAPWTSPCPIEVVFAQYASGRTSFGFASLRGQRGYPTSWEMVVEGPRDRILDAVLPHEITHAIFATHFGQKLPRWADEGACTTVEHESERKKHKVMLVEFLTTRRGIPFNRMFRMMEYPKDMLPLYAQGYSVAQFLINHRGKQQFVDFIGQGLDHKDWDRAVRDNYGYDDLSDLQLTWNDWVRKGSRPWSPNTDPSSDIASNTSRPQPVQGDERMRGGASLPSSQPAANLALNSASPTPNGSVSSESWYFAVMRDHQQTGQPASDGAVTYRRQLETGDQVLVDSLNPQPQYARRERVWR